MMNRHITQWHNPRDCNAACTRVEDVMMKLKALVRSIDEEEGGFRQRLKAEEKKVVKPPPLELPCSPMPGHYRFPEALGTHPQCHCGKRNGLQDYCGEVGQDCYMNPKAVFSSRGQGIPEEQTYSYQNESNRLRCLEDSGLQRGGQHAVPRPCFGENCTNDFYLFPVERKH